jgi:aminoglycoside phosphotransferase (APT) family kinase protein
MEVRWLPVLAPALPVRVPEPLLLVEPDDAFPLPWAVYRWLDGEQATSCTAAELAGLLHALWQLDPSGAPEPGPANAWRGVPLARRDTEAVRRAVSAVDMLDVWESALAAPGWTDAPRWLHGDLDARNLLTRDGRLYAVLDWGCLGVGDPACDVAAAWKLLDARERDRFRVLLDVDDATWERARGWVVSQAAMAATYYTEETNATLLRESQRWLREVRSDR